MLLFHAVSFSVVSSASLMYVSAAQSLCCPTLQTGLIDYAKLEEKALEFRPKMIIAGGSAYCREWDYTKFRAIADKVGAFLMVDMAHIR